MVRTLKKLWSNGKQLNKLLIRNKRLNRMKQWQRRRFFLSYYYYAIRMCVNESLVQWSQQTIQCHGKHPIKIYAKLNLNVWIKRMEGIGLNWKFICILVWISMIIHNKHVPIVLQLKSDQKLWPGKSSMKDQNKKLWKNSLSSLLMENS